MADLRYPVHIARNQHWKGSVRLLMPHEVGPDFVYIPGGPFIFGRGRETKQLALEDFLIQRYPVTFLEYARFLEALEARDGRAAAEERIPRSDADDGTYLLRQPDGTYLPSAVLVSGDIREFCVESYGQGFEGRIPVMGVTWFDAVAYCEWKSSTTQQTWRLPTAPEREKAARGVDGRTFPWGELQDASLAKGRESREHSSQPEPVGAFETAVSVYGMCDAAGGMWDWTASWYDHRKAHRALRGGSWWSPAPDMACSGDFALQPELRVTGAGFRCVRELPGPGA